MISECNNLECAPSRIPLNILAAKKGNIWHFIEKVCSKKELQPIMSYKPHPDQFVMALL
jgi:hypothetical protein